GRRSFLAAPRSTSGIRQLVFELQAKLNRPWLVALQTDLTEVCSTEVRICSPDSGITENHAICHIACLCLKTQPISLIDLSYFEDADIFNGIWEPAHSSVTSWGIAKLQWSWVAPGSSIEVAIPIRVKVVSLEGGDAIHTAIAVRTFGGIKQQTREVVVHRDQERT